MKVNITGALLVWASQSAASAASSVPLPVAEGNRAKPVPLQAPACPGTGTFLRGMALGIFSRGAEENLRPPVRELAHLGIDSVSLVVPKVLSDVRSSRFYSEPTVTPTDESLRRAARLSHAHGMSVLLFPILYIWELGEGEWRGTLSPAEWDGWFARYGEVVLHYAALAREEGIEYFSVGSELCSSEEREASWRDLIRRVREVYPGALTYAANWDHRHTARFLDAVDFLSMNAYFKLAEDGEPTVEDVEERWQPIVQEVDTWASSLGKPLVLAEVGYPSRDGAARDPWDYTVDAPPDPGEQAVLYQAFLRSWARSRTLSGVYFYLWWGEGGSQDTGYTPRGKAAEELLRTWLREDTPPVEVTAP